MNNSNLLVERDAALPLVHLGVSTFSGAAYDPPGLEGLTRIAGRLLRRTAGGRSAEEVDALVDRIGASMGVECGTSSTTLSGSCLKRSLDPYVGLVKDTYTAPGLHEDELERLKRETLAELTEILDSDRQLARRWFLRSVFQDHPYARTVVGTETSLGRISVEDIRRQLGRQLVRGNVIFSFAGDIDPEVAAQISESLHAALPAGSALPDPVPEPAQRKGRHLVFVDKPDRTQTQILIGSIGSHPRDADHFPLLVANTVFGGTFTARMTREVRAKRGWSYGANSSLSYDRKRQSFSMWTFPKAEDAAPCIALELEMLQEWWQDGVSADELEWVKQYLVRSHAFDRDTTSKRVGLRLEEQLCDLPQGYYDRYTDAIQAVTLEQANAAIRKRISLQDLVVVVVGTHATTGAAVKDAIKDLSSESVVPFDTP